jgi:hypothetical protein
VRTRTIILQAHMHQFLGAFGGPGNGDYRGELLRPVGVLKSYATMLEIPTASMLVQSALSDRFAILYQWPSIAGAFLDFLTRQHRLSGCFFLLCLSLSRCTTRGAFLNKNKNLDIASLVTVSPPQDAQRGERTRPDSREGSGVDIPHHTCYYCLAGLMINRRDLCKIREVQLGLTHPNIARSLNNLAAL